jgi:hypothetical protein
MTPEEIKQVLELHAAWLGDREGGKKANLRGANLYGANLYGANLYGANLREANLPDTVKVASLCFGGCEIFITSTHTTIGCQHHANENWLKWQPDDVAEMHKDAKAWRTKHREAVCAVIRDVMAK